MKIERPFHAGELQAQALAGEATLAARNGSVISDSIIPGALAFLRQQTMVILATQSEDGSPVASPLFGLPGFVFPENPRVLRFHHSFIRRTESDPLWMNLRHGAAVGLLAIELATRRRLRVNGMIESVDGSGFVVDVREAFPNCPKYIQRRTVRMDEDAEDKRFEAESLESLAHKGATAVLDAADTLFIASAHEERGADVSHRGGNPGFVERLGSRTIRVPDYTGNSMFNTFGNLLIEPRAGVTVMDFANGRFLQMTGTALISWNQSDEHGSTGGTGRFWTFEMERGAILPIPAQVRSEFEDRSPFNPRMVRGG